MKSLRTLVICLLLFQVSPVTAASSSPQPGYTIQTTYLYGRAMQSSPILKTLRTNVPVRYTTYNRSWSNVYIGNTKYFTPSANLKTGIPKMPSADRLRLVNKANALPSTYRSPQLVTLTIPTVYQKEKITGYNYEPWHLRYVGVTEATMMKQKNLAFEEWWSRR